MQQVVLNLLTNALKFSRDGGKIQSGGSIIRTTRNGKDLKYLEVYVADNGKGISAEDKEKLFKLFGKVD